MPTKRHSRQVTLNLKLNIDLHREERVNLTTNILRQLREKRHSSTMNNSWKEIIPRNTSAIGINLHISMTSMRRATWFCSKTAMTN